MESWNHYLTSENDFSFPFWCNHLRHRLTFLQSIGWYFLDHHVEQPKSLRVTINIHTLINIWWRLALLNLSTLMFCFVFCICTACWYFQLFSLFFFIYFSIFMNQCLPIWPSIALNPQFSIWILGLQVGVGSSILLIFYHVWNEFGLQACCLVTGSCQYCGMGLGRDFQCLVSF